MLNFIRQYRGMFMILVFFVAVAMILSLGIGSTMTTSSGWAGAVAKVEGDTISKRDVLVRLQYQMAQMEETMAEQMKAFGSNPENQRFLEQLIRSQVSPERILDQLIHEKYQIKTSEDLGYVAARKAVRYDIEQTPQFQTNGKFDPLVYKARTGNEPGRYEKDIKNKVKYSGLAATFQSLGTLWSPIELEQEIKVSTVRNFEVLEVDPKKFPEPKTISAADLEAFIKDPSNKVKLEDHYNRNIQQYRKDDQVRVRHILVKGEDAEKKIKTIRKEIVDGKISFEEAAKKYSEDSSNASKGGDLGFFGWGAMQAPFEKAAFALKEKNQISDPVQTTFGFHILRLEEQKFQPNSDFESKKKEVAQEIVLETERKARAQKWLDAFVASGKGPSDQEVKKMGLKWTESSGWKPVDESLPAVGPVGDSLQGLVTLQKPGQIMNSVHRMGDKLFLVRLKKIETPDVAKPELQVSVSDSKVRDTLNFYLGHRFKELEKRKKIVRYQGALEEIKSAVAPRDASGG